MSIYNYHLIKSVTLGGVGPCAITQVQWSLNIFKTLSGSPLRSKSAAKPSSLLSGEPATKYHNHEVDQDVVDNVVW
jgi:hypothetical protein